MTHAADSVTHASCRIVCNGQPRQTTAGTTVAALLAELGLEPRHVAVEVNLELVPRAKHAERMLRDGDQVEIVTLVGGG
jgi:sulfur carrier protein